MQSLSSSQQNFSPSNNNYSNNTQFQTNDNNYKYGYSEKDSESNNFNSSKEKFYQENNNDRLSNNYQNNSSPSSNNATPNINSNNNLQNRLFQNQSFSTDPNTYSDYQLKYLIKMYLRNQSQKNQTSGNQIYIPQTFKDRFFDISNSYNAHKSFTYPFKITYYSSIWLSRKKVWFKLTTSTFRAFIFGFIGFSILDLPHEIYYQKKLRNLVKENQSLVSQIIFKLKNQEFVSRAKYLSSRQSINPNPKKSESLN